jgi:hypothetical protein
MTDQELFALIRDAARIVAHGDTPQATEQAARLRNAGIERGFGVGRRDMDRRETALWYAGQFIEIVEEGAWFAVNSWINALDRFVPLEES